MFIFHYMNLGLVISLFHQLCWADPGIMQINYLGYKYPAILNIGHISSTTCKMNCSYSFIMNCFTMISQSTQMLQIFSTSFTLVRFFPGMSYPMSFQVAKLIKWFTTNLAFIGLFICMNHFMCFQLTRLGETSTTSITIKRFFSSMSSLMSFQTASVCKQLVTSFAFKDIFTVVNLNMISQITMTNESL